MMQSIFDATPDRRQEIDAIMMEAVRPDGAGAAVIVEHDDQTILRTGYGLANIELAVPVRPEMVFRIASVTKQFTGVAILMLTQQGKLALDDPLPKFFPDYPTHGHTITVAHLLAHTSGIKSYTSMPIWQTLWRKDLALGELIDLFKDEPMDFAPGTAWHYNNSGYILLGAIIEQLAEQSYEQFLRAQIFEPLGMQHTCYDDPARIIPGRVAGYAQGPEGLQNAAYLSMTQPHAAGALVSSVDDLATWNRALNAGKVLTPEMLQRAYSPFTLNDGVSTGYGCGWAIADYDGYRCVEHGGSIHGFLSYTLSIPDERLFVALLINSTVGEPPPSLLALKIAAAALGKPYHAPQAIALQTETLDRFVGIYQVDGQDEWVITREGQQLFAQRTGDSRDEIFAISETEFFIDQSFTHLHFMSPPGDTEITLEARHRLGPARRAIKTQKLVAPSAKHDP